MKKQLILFLLAICLSSLKAQLAGTAFLQGQSNHSGIRIKFTAQGGTAVSDSCITSASGNYSINIAPGVYSIKISKAGYIDALYNNGATAVLTNTTVLAGVTLYPGNPVFVNGNVSGTWSSNNVYIVTGNVYIASGNTLTIMPGTTVQFNGYYTISGSGVIKATGNSGMPILFTSGLQTKSRDDWKMIGLTGNGSLYDNCIFEYASFPLNLQGGSANVLNSVFRHCGSLAIYMSTGSPLIENNEVFDLDYPSSNAAIGIWVEGSATGTISCNYIHDIHAGGNSYGIIHNSSLVRDNHISNISGPNPKGIQSRYANSRMINNCISNSGIAIEIDGSWVACNPLIANNTLYGNQRGVHISCQNPTNPTIVNNLITNNVYGITQFGTTSGTMTIDHNLVWNNSSADYTSVQVVGLGQMVTTNSAGHAIDSYYNMSKDPLYNSSAPFLLSNSPCFGTGNTAYSGQIGFSNPTGCVATVVSIHERNDNGKLNIFPNPSSGTFNLSGNPGEEVLISIFDMQGRLLYSKTATPGEEVNVNDLANGMYVLTLTKGETTSTRLLAISK